MSRFLLSKLVVIGIFFSAVSLFAQEDFSVPGLDAPKKAAPTAPAAGTTPGTVEVEDSSLWGMVKKGGWAMWPLGLLSVAAIALSIYFLMDFKAANFAPRELVSRLEGKLAEGDLAGAGDLARNSPACLGAVMFNGTEYVRDRGWEVLNGEVIYDVLADASLDANRGRAAALNYLSLIAQSAPMLGLLGTVSGMIGAFGTMARLGMGNPSLLSGNISEALITTAAGLVIAIPVTFGYFFFRDRLTKMISATEKEAGRLINLLRKAVYPPEVAEEQAHGGYQAPEPVYAPYPQAPYPPQQGYPPQQQGYPPQAMPMPYAEQGYPPQHPGYPQGPYSQQAPYPPQQQAPGGYPPPQQQ